MEETKRQQVRMNNDYKQSIAKFGTKLKLFFMSLILSLWASIHRETKIKRKEENKGLLEEFIPHLSLSLSQ